MGLPTDELMQNHHDRTPYIMDDGVRVKVLGLQIRQEADSYLEVEIEELI